MIILHILLVDYLSILQHRYDKGLWHMWSPTVINLFWTTPYRDTISSLYEYYKVHPQFSIQVS